MRRRRRRPARSPRHRRRPHGSAGAAVVILGNLRVRPVVDGVATIPPTRVYQLAHQADGATGKGTDDTDWQPYGDMLRSDGLMERAVGSFLVETGDRTMLIDAGMAPNPPLPCIGGLL